ncbi:putative structural maintenance of chromosomes protein 1 [Amylocarpus encephaloides]|uniref:Structural maintenance of chromosomes protein n=1 Tax=Amylocarpus encephaloides TaxID=45428 RepID=A0A9P7YQM5_9HELO|nr:putative structural maintenance of chromosomes protein 1 [Amylocarpus encephaloides]
MGKLIRLEVFNFKSYKGHHSLLFGDSYFTSIIGPNGSGKSNSMDAISFVLGIKSSHLRSAHLRDLVYRGRVLKTSKINDDGSAAAPTTNGHANGDADASDEDSQSQRPGRHDPKSAWVMAVYEDDAGDEQKWKRSITNQGASEYRINDRVVTALQYNEALEAENILIKARNFLVFQGDVEQIASQSPKDLTRLIEMVSGSLEHKAEYERLQEEAERAAELQNENLHKRRGMNSEIKQYQEQKREVETFQNKQDQRDDAIVQHILWKLYHFQRVIDESSAGIEEHQQNLKEFRRGVEKYEKQLEEARQASVKGERSVRKCKENIRTKERAIEEQQAGLVPIVEGSRVTSADIEKLRARLESNAKERDDIKSKIQDEKNQLAMVEKAQSVFQLKREDDLKTQGKKLTEADLKEYNTLRSQVVAKAFNNQDKLKAFELQLNATSQTYESIKGKIGSFQAAVDKFGGEVDATEKSRDATKSKIAGIEEAIDEAKTKYNKMQSDRTRYSQLKTQHEEKLRNVLNQLSEARAGHRQNDKERQTEEMIVDLKRLFPGVKGRLGKLCKPKQKKFDEAVITALGRDFDSVIVETEKIGQDCVSYLKERRFPPMTFIPLDNIKVSAVDSSLKSLQNARLTIDTINFDSSLERAMAYACGSSIVCDDLDTAKHICYKKGIQVKAVTLQGFVIHKAGLMTGGRGPERSNQRRFDDHDIGKLDKQRQDLQKAIEEIPNVYRKGADEEYLATELNLLQSRLLYEKRELKYIEQNLRSCNEKLRHAGRQLVEWEPKSREKEVELTALKAKVGEFKEAIAKVEDTIFKKFCERLGYSNIRSYEAQQGSEEQKAAEEKKSFERQKDRLNRAINWQTNQFNEADARVKRLETQITNKEQDIETYKSEREALEEALDTAEAQLTELNDEFQKQKEKQLAKTNKVSTVRGELQKRSREIDHRSKAISALEAEMQRNSAGRYALLRRCKLEQITIPLNPESRTLDSLPVEENILQADPDEMDVDEEDEVDKPLQSINDYGIDVEFDNLDEELKTPDNEDIEDKLQQRIADLNAELEKLNPNMRAIERLDDTEARLKLTEKEFEDARRKAKQSRDQFNEVKEMRFELFNKAFSHISEQISHVYKDLTRSAAYPLGGQAYLDTEDGDSPYLSGIKYHAMPPAKRFRDMEHLSGGEKTMAALALLFAVHSYQPSPFFVLDEVDAALDNANVEKIKNYISEHAGPGMQFIVISLKTGLFQGSESLVGVLRDQEANSSKTLTLDLRKYV